MEPPRGLGVVPSGASAISSSMQPFSRTLRLVNSMMATLARGLVVRPAELVHEIGEPRTRPDLGFAQEAAVQPVLAITHHHDGATWLPRSGLRHRVKREVGAFREVEVDGEYCSAIAHAERDLCHWQGVRLWLAHGKSSWLGLPRRQVPPRYHAFTGTRQKSAQAVILPTLFLDGSS
jgi:hypothetical protein